MRPVTWCEPDPEEVAYEEVRRRRGTREALAIAAIADRWWRRGETTDTVRRWRWAERKYDERVDAWDRGTGYDPDEVYRHIDYEV
jgi:hypothetical protein